MPLHSLSTDDGFALPPGLDYSDTQASFHLFAVPTLPPPSSRRSRRPIPTCVVPDIDLLCDETLSEDEEEGEEGGETGAPWTRIKDPARHSFWEGIECPREAGRGGQNDCSDTSLPPDKKRRIGTTKSSSSSSGPSAPEVRPTRCPEAAVGDRGLLCSDSQEVKAAVAVQVSQAATARGEVGQDGPANIRSHSELSRGGAAPGSATHQVAPTTSHDVTSSSWFSRPYSDKDDDFHTVPDVDVNPDGEVVEGDDLDADSGDHVDLWGDDNGGDSITTPHSLPPNQVTHGTIEPYINEDIREDYYNEGVDSPIGSEDSYVLVDSPIGSEDSYVLYSSQSSNEDEANTPHHQRPLASCDVTYHVVPNAVIEE